MALYDLVSGAIGKSVAKVARVARHALERIAPDADATQRPARKSKGWRKHMRAKKASERSTRP
ncbi:MAG: hypothetical protein V4653_09875 [Pseudomonadota bacterium]